MERITDTHVYFWGSEFSNWYACDFTFSAFNETYRFANSEHAFMWCKAMHFNDFETAEEILNTPSPRHNKELGRGVKNFNAEEWMINGYIYMVAVNKAKYLQNDMCKDILISTGDKIIVEASPFDKIWGIGLHWDNDDVLDESKWQGLNLLGKALMEVRSNLIENK